MIPHVTYGCHFWASIYPWRVMVEPMWAASNCFFFFGMRGGLFTRQVSSVVSLLFLPTRRNGIAYWRRVASEMASASARCDGHAWKSVVQHHAPPRGEACVFVCSHANKLTAWLYRWMTGAGCCCLLEAKHAQPARPVCVDVRQDKP